MKVKIPKRAIQEAKARLYIAGFREGLDKANAECQERVKRIFKEIEDKIWKSYYISPDNKPKVIQGLQTLKKREGID